jgi:RpiR family carbohydrate utilization transcriptional regulator
MNDILSSIQASMPDMRKSEKKVAEYVLRHPERVIQSSITNLAEKTGISEPTVIRFCRKIKLNGYMDLKLNLARCMPHSQQILQNVDFEDSVPEIVNKIFSSSTEAIANTHRRLNMEDMERAVEALVRSERIEFYGVGGSGVLALDAQHKFFRLGTPCIAYTDAHMQSMSAALLDERTTVVAISHSGATKDIMESARIAKSSGATVIGIQGENKTPLSKHCTITLSSNSEEVALKLAPMSSRLAQLAILDALFVAVALRGGEAVNRKLEKVKRCLTDKRY